MVMSSRNDATAVTRRDTLKLIGVGTLGGAVLLSPPRSSEGASPIAALWAVNDGEKVERYDLNNPNKQSNSAWDGHHITVFGARNEIVAFQLIVESGDQGIGSLSAALPIIRASGGPASWIKYSPPDSDPTLYDGRPIQVFSENYMNVTQMTNASWIYYRGSPSEPPDPLGWKPVQLVPENAKQGQGGFPLTVPSRSNQAIWFEIYIPRDHPAGTSHGQVLITADGETREVPLDLRVFDFTLPDRNSLNAMLYYEAGQVELYQGQNLDAAYHRFAHRNRVEFVNGYDIPAATAAQALFTGAYFTSSNGYSGPGAGYGNILIPRSFYGPGPDFDTPDKAGTSAKPWTDWLRDHGFASKQTFLYMPDEPSTSQFPFIRSIAEAVHGSGAPLPIFETHAYSADLDGPDHVIDIWAVTADSYDIPVADQLRREGRDMWPYNGQRPNIGSVVIDSPATDPRATMWACFRHGVPTYFYWHVDQWQHNSQVAPGWPRNQNVWQEPITYFNKGGEYANGDGVLIYPGQERVHPAEDRGVPGPVGTIQLANIRRGLQDHLYLTVATALGLEDMAQSTANQIVPRVFSDVTANDRVTFPQDGNSYENARFNIGRVIELARKH